MAACEHCAKERGVHDPDCPNYFTGNALLGVPDPQAPPDTGGPGEAEGS